MMEVCAGCGNVASSFPIVGIKRDPENYNHWASFPICEKCWKDPKHRVFPLKMHFFDKRSEQIALERAGSTDLGG